SRATGGKESRTCRSGSAARGATTAVWCWPRSWPGCSSAWASRPGSITGTLNVAEHNEHGEHGSREWKRLPPAPAPIRIRRPTGGRRPLTPMPKGDPSALGGPPPGGPAVVALGGGHGLATALAAVRRYAGSVTAVVSVADDGGSSGRLRKDHDVPAPGDLRKCLVALAASDTVWREAFEHRFHGGDLDGHALGNLVIVGLAQVLGDFGRALEEAAPALAWPGEG